MTKPRALTMLVLLISTAAPCAAQNALTLVGTDHHGNFHTAGIVVTVSGDDNRNGSIAVEQRLRSGTAADFSAAHPAVRIDDTRFVASLFRLESGTGHVVRLTLADPDGVIGTSSVEIDVDTRPDVFPEPTLRTLYVSPDGSNSNPGTDPLFPLETIQHAADLSQPGDLILVGPGVYRESVTVPTSGTAAQPIVFRGSGVGAILDGADEGVLAGVPWTDEGAGVWSSPIGFPTGHVVTDQGRLFRYDSVAELETLGAGAPGGFFVNGSTLSVKIDGGGSPAARQMHVARHEDGFYIGNRSHVRVENLEIRHYGSGSYGKGVYLRYSSDCAVRSCRIHEVGSAGVWIKGGERNTIEGNELWDTSIFDWPWPFTKGSSSENNAVALTNEIGRGNVIRDNTIRGFFNGVGPCGSAPPPVGFTSETDVYDNRFTQHTDDALEPEGWCANVRLWGNHIEDAHMAFAVAPAAPGPTWIVHNVAYNFGNTRTSQLDGYTASALKINSGYSTPIGPLFLYHNTFLTEAPETDALALLNPGESTLITARNNAFAGTQYALYKVNPVILDFDWDDLYTTDPIRFVRWEGTQLADLAALQGFTGQESNGVESPPLLTDPAGGDFAPTAGSDLIDRGVVIAGINDGFEGLAPDIGAVETGSPLFADGFETGDTTRWSTTIR
jgi:parallel beta-helix repeat protein